MVLSKKGWRESEAKKKKELAKHFKKAGNGEKMLAKLIKRGPLIVKKVRRDWKKVLP